MAPGTRLKKLSAEERVVYALDVDSLKEAQQWVARLKGVLSFFKIGKQLFTGSGLRAVEMVKGAGCRLFLDLKYHDIPSTVGSAVAQAARVGADLITVHCSGGLEMMREAARVGGSLGITVVGVTVLTSLDDAALAQVGLPRPAADQVILLTRLAREAGLHGVVASPKEVKAIREMAGPDFLLVTPGIRQAGRELHDQARTSSAADAIKAGADLLVVGRPIKEAGDPVETARSIVAEVARAFEGRQG